MDKESRDIAEVLIRLEGKRVIKCDDIAAFQYLCKDGQSDNIYYNKYHRYYLRPCKRHECMIKNAHYAVFELFEG